MTHLPDSFEYPVIATQAVTPLDEPSENRIALPFQTESATTRLIYLLLALAITVAFFYVLLTFYAPAPGDPGIDENAYLVGGKNFAGHLSPGLHTSTPYAYVGSMWIRAKSGVYYPKYPAGIPALDAIAIWLTPGHSNLAAFIVSPVCAALAVLGLFFFTRVLAGSFLALLAMIALAANPTHLELALIPSSHAPAICFAVWGMYCLLCWLGRGRILTGVAAGFLLGYTFTIRYSEGLLLLPLAAAVLMRIRWTNPISYLRAAVPVVAWAIPVGALLLFNYITTHHLTGYDSTNESTGFTFAEFKSKWEMTVHQLNMYGLFLLFPLGVVGMLVMFDRAWRFATLVLLWLVPGLLLYMAYYWGRQIQGVGYLRFFLTLYPPVIASAMYLLAAAQRNRSTTNQPGFFRAPFAIAVGAGLLTASTAAAGLYVALPDLRQVHVHNQNLAFTAQAFLKAVPEAHGQKGKPTPLYIVDDGGIFGSLAMYMQFVGDGEWCANSAFSTLGGFGRGLMAAMSRGGGGGRSNEDSDQPNPVLLDPARADYLMEFYKDKSQADLTRDEQNLVKEAIVAGRPVIAVLTPANAPEFEKRMHSAGLTTETLAWWVEPLTKTDLTGIADEPGGLFNWKKRQREPERSPGLGPPAQVMRVAPLQQTIQLIKVTRPVG